MTPIQCSRCGTELPPAALACPACTTLVHSGELKRLADEADAATRSGDLVRARDRWTAALQLLPTHSQQHAAVSARIVGLGRQVEAPSTESAKSTPTPGAWWRRGIAGFITAALVLGSKLKFLLLGLTKATTFVSMFAFFGVYWSIYGWPLALGLVLSIYIHEMGHVSMLRRLGIESGAPMFIPGVGALVMLRQHVTDPLTDAKIGLAGPMWGLGAAVAALGCYGATRAPIWFAIAQLTGFINLFNLIPVWQLDGSRGLHVLARGERWILVMAVLVALFFTEQRLLLIVAGVAVWRALQDEAGPGNAQVLATFVGLVFALALIARDVR